MPKVGDMYFPYTQAGYKAAQTFSKTSGLPVVSGGMGQDAVYSKVKDLEGEGIGSDLYSNVGNSLIGAYGKGMDTRGGSRVMGTPGLDPKTAVASKQTMPWEQQQKTMEY